MDNIEKGFFYWKVGLGNFYDVFKFCNSFVIDFDENFIFEDFYY